MRKRKLGLEKLSLGDRDRQTNKAVTHNKTARTNKTSTLVYSIQNVVDENAFNDYHHNTKTFSLPLEYPKAKEGAVVLHVPSNAHPVLYHSPTPTRNVSTSSQIHMGATYPAIWSRVARIASRMVTVIQFPVCIFLVLEVFYDVVRRLSSDRRVWRTRRCAKRLKISLEGVLEGCETTWHKCALVSKTTCKVVVQSAVSKTVYYDVELEHLAFTGSPFEDCEQLY